MIAALPQAGNADCAGTFLVGSVLHPSRISLFPAQLQLLYCAAGKLSPCASDVTDLPVASCMQTYLFFINKQVEMKLRKDVYQRFFKLGREVS